MVNSKSAIIISVSLLLAQLGSAAEPVTNGLQASSNLGTIPSVGPVLSAQQQAEMNQELQRQYQAEVYLKGGAQTQIQFQGQAQPGLDPSILLQLLGTLGSIDTKEQYSASKDQLDEWVREGVISEATRDRALRGESFSVRLPEGKRVRASYDVTPQKLTPQELNLFNSKPRSDICKDMNVKTEVGGHALPCEAIQKSLALLSKCPGSFPNRDFIVVNDFSRTSGDTFRSWLIPVSQEADGRFVVAEKFDQRTKEVIQPESFPVSSGKLYSGGAFCSRGFSHQSPAGFHLTSTAHHETEKDFPCNSRAGDCNLPGVGNDGESPKIGMVGIENGLNSNSMNRGILIHAGWYAGGMGSSNGCAVVPHHVIPKYWKSIGGRNGGALVNNFIGDDPSRVCLQDRANFKKSLESKDGPSCESIRVAALRQKSATHGNLVAEMDSSSRTRTAAGNRTPAKVSNVR